MSAYEQAKSLANRHPRLYGLLLLLIGTGNIAFAYWLRSVGFYSRFQLFMTPGVLLFGVWLLITGEGPDALRGQRSVARMLVIGSVLAGVMVVYYWAQRR